MPRSQARSAQVSRRRACALSAARREVEGMRPSYLAVMAVSAALFGAALGAADVTVTRTCAGFALGALAVFLMMQRS